ncbi:TonB-dependent receptor [Novosphingobium sp. G106]|uniref:TonB-dependent receptor n=1 Tax=Novosphingobium sp. G106 TaxID=2849500 RepID=UPI001C2D9A9C|nr:TonB-dependent receptor [Novosphingobium sp. G106]MBV1688856.1 TonB-dependent receptor [Novosphingobium sp. G106]
MKASNRIAFWFAGTSLVIVGLLPVQAAAQNTASEDSGLDVIVVTAQKREQSVQDVPIAVTALSSEALQANRVTNVNDLSGLAPGVTVRPSAGGSSVPTFTIRGAASFGVVPGSDKQISTYLDGVYISAPRGSIFELPDVSRIEVLRGPQGTLFGRNATAGAVSITTRDPSGKFGFRGSAAVGNRDAYRLRASIDTPEFGPFSASFSYVRDYIHGDILNLGAGTVWDRTVSPDPLVAKVRVSPKWLGTRDSNTYFAALKFESGDFKTVYKFDLSRAFHTPEGTGIVGYNPNQPGTGAFVSTLIQTQPTPVPIASDGLRPKAVMNSYVIPTDQKNEGHSLTSTYTVNDQISLKNVFAFRKSFIFANASIDGISALTLTAQAAPLLGLPASLVGSPFLVTASQTVSRNKQYSDELQVNYNSDLLTLTLGGLWFKSEDTTGTFGFTGTIAFRPLPGGKFTLGSVVDTLNKATSVAGYGQAEVHVTPQLDLVGGIRVTRDSKTGRFILGTAPATQTILFRYRDTRPSYLVGVNYKPNDDTLVYAKFSTAFVSGGSVAGLDFAPETAKSVEGGVKTEFFDHNLRANLAVYWVQYKNFQQSSTSTLVPGAPPVGTFLISAGTITSKGFEFEMEAAPTRGVRLGGSLAYSDTKLTDPKPLLLAANGGAYTPTQRPKWTASLFGQYESEPLWDEARLLLRADAQWQSKMLLDPNLSRSIVYAPNFAYQDAYWNVNARAALRNINIGGVETELAAYARNLFNSRAANSGLSLNYLASSNYVTARTYGVELNISF